LVLVAEQEALAQTLLLLVKQLQAALVLAVTL
jgi:hypothetical protein